MKPSNLTLRWCLFGSLAIGQSLNGQLMISGNEAKIELTSGGPVVVPNAPADTPLSTLARVAMSRWPIETEFEDEKSQVALDEYEVRSWDGWHHHITMCLLASAFLLHLQQDWGKKDAPDHPTAGVSHRLRTVAAPPVDERGVALVAGGDPAAQ